LGFLRIGLDRRTRAAGRFSLSQTSHYCRRCLLRLGEGFPGFCTGGVFGTGGPRDGAELVPGWAFPVAWRILFVGRCQKQQGEY